MDDKEFEQLLSELRFHVNNYNEQIAYIKSNNPLFDRAELSLAADVIEELRLRLAKNDWNSYCGGTSRNDYVNGWINGFNWFWTYIQQPFGG